MTIDEDHPKTLGSDGVCPKCDKRSFLVPLHGDKGGPLLCFLCAGAWHAKHTRRRKWGRIIIKAMKVFFDAGGKWDDVEKLKWHAFDIGGPLAGFANHILPGYEDTIGAEVGDITSELLADTLQLTHPDRHPLERQKLAHRVTQELLALKPFVFPAPKPEPVSTVTPPPPRDTSSVELPGLKEPSYPCELCADQFPHFYCTACKAEWSKRQQEKWDRRTAKQRKWYARRKERRALRTPPTVCTSCGAKLKGKRTDARFCSDTCRQRAHRKSVTDKTNRGGETLISRDGLAAAGRCQGDMK